MRDQAWVVLVCSVQAVAGLGLLDSAKNSLLSFFSNSDLVVDDVEMVRQRSELKSSLLDECKRQAPRDRIEEIMRQLAEISPTPESAQSPLLRKKWLLEWTTEKEINFFIDWKLCGGVTQTISDQELGNRIPFKNGGFLGVTGQLEFSEGARTNFKFTDATLDLGFGGAFSIPPVGEGWFDTIYLDDELRVDINSRDDILICTPLDEASE